jgi:hypothetical protein
MECRAMNPFRFGVSVWHAPSRAEWIAKARKIEDLGFSSLLVPDHLNERVAPMPALISAAEATKRIRVGTYVLNNDLRAGGKAARKRIAPATGPCSPGLSEQGVRETLLPHNAVAPLRVPIVGRLPVKSGEISSPLPRT